MRAPRPPRTLAELIERAEAVRAPFRRGMRPRSKIRRLWLNASARRQKVASERSYARTA